MFYTVYQTTNLINQKIYRGSHITNNPNDDYLGSGKWLKSAIAKYGIDSFKKEILCIFDNAKDMFAKEAELVNEEFVKRKDTYNLKVGGTGGWDYVNNLIDVEWRKLPRNWKKETKEKQKIVGKTLWERTATKESRNAIVEKIVKFNIERVGWSHTDEAKQKIGKANSVHQSGSNNSQFGTCWINNGEINKKIPKNNLAVWIHQGYYKGRITPM